MEANTWEFFEKIINTVFSLGQILWEAITLPLEELLLKINADFIVDVKFLEDFLKLSFIDLLIPLFLIFFVIKIIGLFLPN